MALRLGAIHDALIDAGATPDKAKAAAEELAAYERLDARVTLLAWMVGINITLTIGFGLGNLWVLFNLLARLAQP